MKSYIIGFSLFIVVLFIIALAIDFGDETGDIENVDEILEADVIIDKLSDTSIDDPVEEVPEPIVTTPSFDTSAMEIPIAVKSVPEQILVRVAYTTSYNKKTKCPNWVAWCLTKEHTDGPFPRKGVPYLNDNERAYYGITMSDSIEVNRGDYFIDMDAVAPRQNHDDWRDHPSSIEHGHMCPAADNRWNRTVMNQSFLLTNMCPQEHDVNFGGWQWLEERCRTWARKYDSIYIACGPIFEESYRTMGNNKVGIPNAFFKVILSMKDEPKTIGFIMPNKPGNTNAREYVRTVDEIEAITGFDFFHNLPDSIEDQVERECELDSW